MLSKWTPHVEREEQKRERGLAGRGRPGFSGWSRSPPYFGPPRLSISAITFWSAGSAGVWTKVAHCPAWAAG